MVSLWINCHVLDVIHSLRKIIRRLVCEPISAKLYRIVGVLALPVGLISWQVMLLMHECSTVDVEDYATCMHCMQ